MRTKKNWLIFLIVGLVLVLVGLVVKNKFFSRQAYGALSISSFPKAVVFIDGIQTGITPFLDDKIATGEHTIKLVPESVVDDLVSWEGKVTLTANILTVINRSLGSTDSVSAGETIYLEKIGSRDKSALAVVSAPSQAVVKIDGEPKGFSPVLVEDLEPAEYQIAVTSSGYEERVISAKTVAGYKLIVDVQLAQKVEGIEEATASAEEEEVEEEKAETTPTPEVTPEVTPEATITPPEKPYVKIKSTPTGFLRVRMGPSRNATIAAQVNPGGMYPYLDEEGDWYKIEYEEDKEGWVYGIYAELIE